MPEPEKTPWWKRSFSILGYVVGIAGSIYSYLSYATVLPTYYATPVETIARRDSPRLSMKWDAETIESLCVCRVAFWNAGKVSMRADMLPASDPLRIVADNSARILSAELSNSSRTTLRVLGEIHHGQSDTVALSIAGADALELLDGVGIRLLFTGDCQRTSITVVGRVIGASSISRISDGSFRASKRAQLQKDSITLGICLILIAFLGKILERSRGKKDLVADVAKYLLGPVAMILMGVSFIRSWMNYIPDWFPF